MAERFTAKQGQYLAFIYNYAVMFGRAPAEADLQRFFRTTPPTVHQMLLTLANKQLISRTPGQARSIKILVDPRELPILVPPKKD
jgi:DNA-binding MarR family transcriptional regulator